MQNEIDSIFYGPGNPLAELIKGTPTGGTEKEFYATVERYSQDSSRMRGGHQTIVPNYTVNLSKTDWPVVTKGSDSITIKVNGFQKTMRITSILYEDSYSYRVALV